MRSASSAKSAAVRIGNASRISTLVTSAFQVKIGIRNSVMPGARRQTIVAMKLTPPRIVPRPPTARPANQRFAAGTRGVHDVGQRRVGGPPEVGRAARGQEARHRDQATEEEQPVREGVQPRERDVGGADLQRHDQVREREEQRRREQQQHHRAVHGEQLVVLLRRQELQPRPRQLATHQHGHQAARDEERERGDQVHQADGLVVGGPQQVRQPRALHDHASRARPTHDGCRCNRHGAQLRRVPGRLLGADKAGAPTTAAHGAARFAAGQPRRPVGADVDRDGDPHRLRQAAERRLERRPPQVPGVRPHPDERGDGRPVQPQLLPVRRRRDRRAGAARGSPPGARPCRGPPAAAPSGPTSSAEVVGGRGDDDQPALGPQDPRDLRPVARARTPRAPGRRRRRGPAAAPRCPRPPRRRAGCARAARRAA